VNLGLEARFEKYRAKRSKGKRREKRISEYSVKK
jgi:hypothetical protein